MSKRKIDDLLSSRQSHHSRLTHLLKHAASQASWTAQLQALLPADLADHCRVADLSNACLTIQVTSASWATRLRFMAEDLLPSLQRLSDFGSIQEIRLQVMPSTADTGDIPSQER